MLVFQSPPAARQFYASKVEDLGKNLKDLESIIQGKQGNLTVLEDSMSRSAALGKLMLTVHSNTAENAE